jgi:CheY-like chemotaxis protein/putative methionine-R-sulfoxide reductase with GAF domain
MWSDNGTMSERTTIGRLLVLAGPSESGDQFERSPLVRTLAREFDLTIVESMADALLRLREEDFDAVISATGDFLPLERAVTDQQSTAVLNTLGQGVCLIDRDGRLLWQNRMMESYGEPVREQVARHAERSLSVFDAAEPGASPRPRRFTCECEGRVFELIITPLGDGPQSHGATHLAAVVLDVTASRRLRQKLNAIDQAGRELVRLEAESVAKMNMQQRLQLLEKSILRYTRDLLNFDNFGIWLLDESTGRLTMVLSEGFPSWIGEMELYAGHEGNGITGHVAASGRSYICADTQNDPRYIQGIEAGASSLTVPLRLQNKVIGVLNVESDTPGYFTEDDRQFAEIFSRYIAIALNTLDALVQERATTTDRFVRSVADEIDQPLNDIVEAAVALIEENIGHDELRGGLNRIIDRVTAIKRTVGQVADAPTTMLGRRQIDQAEHDPMFAGRRILVADDDEHIIRDARELLGKKGAIVEPVRDGAEAMAMVSSRDFDLVLCDIRMPHASGYDIFCASRDRSPNTPVILMTGFGYDPRHSIFKARQEGVFGVMFKPFQADDLVNQARAALEQRDAGE